MNLNYFYLILAMALLFSGHVLRIIRWEFLINTYEKAKRSSLFGGLFLGYLLNLFLPFHIGEIGRAYYAGKKMENGQSFSLITVIIDRYLDVVCVGIIFLCLLSVDHTDSVVLHSAVFYVGMCVVLLLLSLIVFFFSSQIKRITKLFASVFNDQIEYHILAFVFSAITGFKDLFKNITKLRVLGNTIFMWGCYISSYYFFALFEQNIDNNVSLKAVFIELFGSFNLLSLGGINQQYLVHMLAFLMIPNLLLLVLALGKDSEEGNKSKLVIPLMRREERLQFLEDYFGNKRREYLLDYLNMNRDVSILRDYSAGSNASTMLCASDSLTFFRKFAFGNDGKVLEKQCAWIREHDYLKLPQIIGYEKSSSSFLYDMPYNPSAMTMFSYIHGRGANEGFAMIQKIIKELDDSLYKRPVDADINAYIDKKVKENLEKLYSNKRSGKLAEHDKIIINGKEYNNINHYAKYFDSSWLFDILSKDSHSEGHGDLTLENIIVDDTDYYLIDPNPIKELSGKNLDLGKILQSLHSGYEFRRLVNDVSIKGNRVDYFMTFSHAYHEVYNQLKEYLKKELSLDDLKSVYTHELIHYLRLLPYRMESANFAVFYCAFLEILDDYEKMWG